MSGQVSCSSNSISPAEEIFPDIDFDVVNIRGEFDEPTPDEMDPMLDFNDENDEIIVPIGWKKHLLKAPPRKLSGLDGNFTDRDTIPKSSAPILATAKNVPARTTSPLDFWKLYFNLKIMDQFVTSTNKFGRKDQALWEDITVDILYKFFSIIFFMGLVRQPEIRSFWSKDPKYRREWVRRIMSRDRFKQIWTCLHFVDVTTFTHPEIKAKNSLDGFWRVACFVESLAKTSGHFCRAGRAFDIDEMCIFFKGRHKCRCYNGSKPEKWHFKAFALNDPTTGYYLNFYLYGGKGEVRPDGLSATAYPIYRLLKDEVYHHKWHVLATDNWFSSMDVLRICLERGMNFVGTFRPNKQGIPKDGVYTKNGPNKAKGRGDVKCQVSTIDITRDGKVQKDEIFFTAWFDNKEVHMLSSYPVYIGSVERRSKSKEGVFEMLELPRPSAVENYNKIMGGTDLGDQLGSYYRFEHQTTKWPHRIFTHFMMLAAVNAHILRNWTYPDFPITLKVFIEDLMDELSGQPTPAEDDEEDDDEDSDDEDDEEVPVEEKKVRGKAKNWLENKRRLERNTSHTPLKVSCSKPDERGKCVVCSDDLNFNKSFVMCTECDAFLHIDGTGKNSCWWRFHNMKNFKK